MKQEFFDAPLPNGGTTRMSYYVWGKPDSARTAFCVHGLTRNGRDFDFLAEALVEDGFRVVCPDMPGRGKSAWLTDPALYATPVYIAQLNALMQRLSVTQVDWIGTSMGGIIGMTLAAMQPATIRTLVLNDVGSFIPKAALERLKTYVGVLVNFPSREAGEAALRVIYTPFGITREDIWRHLFDITLEDNPAGGVRAAYDPAIGNALKSAEVQDVDMWPLWERITCPVLLLRGETSDILDRQTAEHMAASRVDVNYMEIPHVGHAPTLMVESEITLVKLWLRSTA